MKNSSLKWAEGPPRKARAAMTIYDLFFLSAALIYILLYSN